MVGRISSDHSRLKITFLVFVDFFGGYRKLIGSFQDFLVCKEKRGFPSSVFIAVRGVDGIAGLAFGKTFANGAVCCLCWVGSTDQRPEISHGIFFSNIRLAFKDGKIIEAYSHVNNDKLQEILETDDGAKYMGEFAFGLNPGITHPILDILFDEKIGGSFHMAIGNSYDEAPNGNSSAVHWDLIQMQDAAHGGGEIYLDDVLVRKDGLFVLPELQGLNPEI